MDKACLFGVDDSLLGIVSEPADRARAAKRPVLLILNANVLHRVGPYRLHVMMARQVCALGGLAFRFDMSGIGDSPARSGRTAYHQRVLGEVGEAMDYISSAYRSHEFVLMGLCAGADSAYQVAMQDQRVKGLLLLDGYGHRNLGYYLSYYLPRMMRLSVWRRFFGRKISKPHKDTSEFLSGVRDFPTRQQMTQDISTLSKRGVCALWIYSGGVENYYNHQRQFKNTYRIKADAPIDVKYHRDADHTYTQTRHRNVVLSELVTWYKKQFLS